MYWLEENAEGMFAIRALILCERWEDTLSRLRQTMARDRRINWKWIAPDLTKLNPDETVSPPCKYSPKVWNLEEMVCRRLEEFSIAGHHECLASAN